MINIKSTVVIVMLVYVVTGPVCSAEAARTRGKSKNPTALELLDKYAETQDQFQSFRVKVSTVHRSVSKELMARQPWKGRYSTDCDARFDRSRASVRVRSWGKINRTDYYKQDKPYYVSDLWDGENHFQYTEAREEPVHLSIGEAKVANMRDGVIKHKYSGKFFMGYFFPFSERVDFILRKAGNLSVRRTTEKVGGSPCYVISGVYEKDKYTIWLAPEHGYHIAKAVVERPRSNVQGLQGFRVEFKNVRFKKIDDKWVPVSANLENYFYYQKGRYSNSSYYIRVTEMVFNPDHDALRSFVPDDIKDGTWIPFFVDSQSPYYPQYFWSKEPKVVADRKRRLLKYEPDGSMFPVIKTLTKFKYFDLKFEPDETKDKMVLLCFVDIKQSSQEYAYDLAARASKLAEEDVLIILVDASGSEKKQIDDWAKQHSIKVPVGRLFKELLKEIRRAWGIETLPRLVLTDRNHVIVAEGFAFDELEAKIKEADNAI